MVFVERNPRTVSSLRQSAETLDTQANCRIEKRDVLSFLDRTELSFDIVFLDPPFAQPDLLHQSLARLAKQEPSCRFVYAEARNLGTLLDAAECADFSLVKHTKSGDTAAGLLIPNRDIAGSLGQG